MYSPHLTRDKNCFIVATTNVQCGLGTTQGYWEYIFSFWKYWFPHSQEPLKNAASCIHKNHVDVTLCTEISGASFRTRYTSQVEMIASLIPAPFTAFFKIGGGGNAVISRFPILEKKVYPLTGTMIARALGYSLIEIDGRNVHFFVTHLSLSAPLRLLQMKELIAIITNMKGPIVLAGDFNSTDGSLMYIEENSQLKNCGTAPTFPSWNPKFPLDAICISPELRCTSLYTDSSSLFSDHLPLVAKISFC